jgi:hypothetical protein
VIDGTGALISAITQVILGYMNTDQIFYLFAGYTFLGAISLTPILWKDYQMRNTKVIDLQTDQNI